MLAGSSFSSISGHTVPYPATFYDVHGRVDKKWAGLQVKYTVVLGLVLKHDQHDKTEG